MSTMKKQHTRGEVLSVKASAVEKDMIIRAAQKLGITYSEFVRVVSIGACRKLGIEQAESARPEDVRRRKPPRKPSPTDASGVSDQVMEQSPS